MLKVTLSIVPGGTGPERQLGELQIINVGGGRVANYRCVLVGEDLPHHLVTHVERYPRWSAPTWDLVARAISTALRGQERLPRRPSPLQVPVRTDPDSGRTYVRVSDIPEPARTAFSRWITGSDGPVVDGEAVGDCVYAWDWSRFIGPP
jgi:hypothetical protein